MNSSFRVVLDTKFLAIHNNITGVIYLSMENTCFPERGWSDFPAIILQWWLEGFRALSLGSEPSVICNFMDGPYFFTVTNKESHIEIECVVDRKIPKTIVTHRTTIDAAMGEVKRAGNILVAECTDRGWDTKEIRDLAVLMATM